MQTMQTMQNCEFVVENKKSKMVDVAKLLPDELDGGRMLTKTEVGGDKIEVYVKKHSGQGGHDSKHLKLPKDLREMNEEQFIEVFNLLKEKTNDFKEFSPDLLIENNQYLLILRCCLGLPQKELGKKLGTTKDWVRHTEAGRNRILHAKIAERWVPKLEYLLSLTNISQEKSLEFWRRLQFARDQNLPNIRNKRKPISKLSEEDLKRWFETIRVKTNNFTNFERKILIENPQNVLIFRVVLGLNHRVFAGKLNCSPRGLRRWEHLEMKMRPHTAEDLTRKIRQLFSEIRPKIDGETVLFNFRVLTNRFGNRNFEALSRSGLSSAKNQIISSTEKEILDILNNEGVSVEVHPIVDGLKRKYNVDFAIPNGCLPTILIETFDFSLNGKTVGHSKYKVCHIDHRFQMIKSIHPNVKTILYVKFKGRPICEELSRKSLETEILNTNYIVINRIEKLIQIIKDEIKLNN